MTRSIIQWTTAQLTKKTSTDQLPVLVVSFRLTLLSFRCCLVDCKLLGIVNQLPCFLFSAWFFARHAHISHSGSPIDTICVVVADDFFSTHPLAREVRFVFLLFGFETLKSSYLDSYCESGIRESLYHMAYSWFAVRPQYVIYLLAEQTMLRCLLDGLMVLIACRLTQMSKFSLSFCRTFKTIRFGPQLLSPACYRHRHMLPVSHINRTTPLSLSHVNPGQIMSHD